MSKSDNNQKNRNGKNLDMDEEVEVVKKKDDEEKSTLEKIIMIIVIIIIILLLITSCSSIFFGKIGNNLNGSSDYDINNEDKNYREVYDKELRFIKSKGTTYVGEDYKIGFVHDDLNTNKFGCTTSNSKIATCVVKGNYVIINTKKKGKVTISVTTTVNGIKYIGTHELTVKAGRRSISLASINGTINLSENDHINVPYSLNNLSGKITVTSSDSSVATAVAKDGILTITGHKKGKATITLTIEYNGVKYEVTYTVDVISNGTTHTTSNTMPNKTNNIPSNNNQGNNKPSGSSTVKSGENSLKYIYPSEGSLNPKFNKNTIRYEVIVSNKTNHITLDVGKVSNKSKLYYYVDGVLVNNLNNIKLEKDVTEVKIVVEAENGALKTYIVKIKKEDKVSPSKSSIKTLESLSVSPGTLFPNFNKDLDKYNVEVDNNVDKITVTYEKTDSKSKVTAKLEVNGKVTDLKDLKDIPLKVGKNKIIITVKAEDGTTKNYEIIVERKEKEKEKDTTNTLINLSIKDFVISPNFDSENNKYTATVKYDTETIDVTAIPKSSKSTWIYKLNGEEIKDSKDIQDLKNIKLKEGINTLEIIVTSESGEKNTYTIIITKPIREIRVDKNVKDIYIENTPIGISYGIYEDGKLTTNYGLNDINIDIPNYKGSYEIKDGVIILTPSKDDIGNSYKMTIEYLGKKDTLDFNVKMKDYFISAESDDYTFSYIDGNKNEESIIINTNIFNGNMSVEDIDNGIKIYNDNGYITIESSNTDVVKIKYDKSENKDGTDYISILNELLKTGSSELTISGNIYGKEIETISITINVVEKFSIVIDAQDGFFNELTNKQEIFKKMNETINLKDYVAYKVDKTGNCMYYELESYNTKPDGTGTRYELDQEVKITGNLTLYAIYKEESKYIELKETDKTLYLTDVDLFHNEEYYKVYKKDKIIYPGAHGSHVMYIKNNSDSIIEIKNVNIKEKTTCIDDLGCINMGYIIKYTRRKDDVWKYYYGGNNDYQILNKDKYAVKDTTNGFENSIKTPTKASANKDKIKLEPGEDVAISLLWEWVDIDDDLDTQIGSIKQDQDYIIYVSVDYDKTNKYCKMK